MLCNFFQNEKVTGNALVVRGNTDNMFLFSEQRWSSVQEEVDHSDDDDDDNDEDDSGMQILSAKFHFVDLAGSERAHKTGNAGERFKGRVKCPTRKINKKNILSSHFGKELQN